MKSVIINGEESEIQGVGLPKVADLIELIKSSIDPEHMITSILIDGRDLAESDWVASTAQFSTSIIEVETGTPSEFVNTRLAAAAAVVRECFFSFRDARKCFQEGNMQEGNQKLVEAVNTLQAFFEWYVTMLDLLPEEERAMYKIEEQADGISEVCKKICQQQLYQSWWALGETLQGELEPKLDELEDYCRTFASQV